MVSFTRKQINKELRFHDFSIPKNSTILKIMFEEKDIRKTEKGRLHVDIFGFKIYDLLDTIIDVMRDNRRLEKELSLEKDKNDKVSPTQT